MSLSPNEKYPGATEADPNYKDSKFKDNNPSTTNNGSPLKALDRNEQLALQEAMMNAAGFDYNGVVDTPQNSQMFNAYKAALSNGANLLSNHNFIIASPDDSQPAPSATPTSYPPGHQIFSGVFANETTGITNLTYIDGRVSFSGGDFYMSVPNTGALENITEFVASVADFDGKPRTRGVSFALVGDEYRVTVGVDALTDVGGNDTLLGSVKFEQGSVATGHETESISSRNLADYTSLTFKSVQDLVSYGAHISGNRYTTPNNSWIVMTTVGSAKGFVNLGDNLGAFPLVDKVCINDFGLAVDGTGDQSILINSTLDNFDKCRLTDGLYGIENPVYVKPKQCLEGTDLVSTMENDTWKCILWKKTNTLDGAGLDSIVSMHDNTPVSNIPSNLNGNNARMAYLSLMGNISTGYPNTSAGGADASNNEYGIYTGYGPNLDLEEIAVLNCANARYTEGCWLSSLRKVIGFGRIAQVSGTSTTHTGCYGGFNMLGGFYFEGVSYSSLVNCGTDLPFNTGYTFKNSSMELSCCAQERFALLDNDAANYPTDKGIYFDFQGNNKITVTNHKAFNNRAEQSNPDPVAPLYHISAKANDRITFINDDISVTLPPDPNFYSSSTFRLEDDAFVKVISPGPYLREPNVVVHKVGSSQGVYDNAPYIEQDEFQPSLALGGDTSGFGYVYRQGFYQRVGDVVSFTFSIYANVKGTGTGQLTIPDIPYSSTSQILSAAIVLENFTGLSNGLAVGEIENSGDSVNIFESDGTTPVTDVNIPASTFIQVRGTVTYKI